MNFMQNVCIYVLFSATKLHSFHHILKAIHGPKKLGTHVLEWHQNTLAKVIQSLKKKKKFEMVSRQWLSIFNAWVS